MNHNQGILKYLAGVFYITLLFSVSLTADDVIVNTWKPIGDGKYPPPEGNWPNLSGPQFCWIPTLDFGLMAPILTEKEGRNGAGYRKISFDKPEWEFVPGKYSAGLIPDMWDSPKGYLYLPGLKKILFLKQEWHHSQNKKQPVESWLLGLEDTTWEPILENFSMSDKSSDFNSTPGKDGLRLPIWGTLCYDALNKEAVSFGGGGIWGRVSSEKETVKEGDWIFDETLNRTRRLTADDSKITSARRWYPGHSGTWIFSESEKKWSATKQPLGQQPSARILPGMAYDSDQKKIVLFGGDDLARCFSDTWVYDCANRTWAQLKPSVSPSARAGHAMVYVPDQKVILLIGGYAGSWQPLKDVWVFKLEKGEWQKLALDLPSNAGHASAAFDEKRGLALALTFQGLAGNKTAQLFSLKLDLDKAPKAEAVAVDPSLSYHCKNDKRMGGKLPSELLEGDLAVTDSKAALAAISSQPANTWVVKKPPFAPPARNWGSSVYDSRTHRGYTWGGGHSTYPGSDVIEYHVEADRWYIMKDAPNYNPRWLHGMVGGPPGVSFGGWSLLPTHSRKSYGIDELSNSLITYVGDVYDLKHQMFVANIGLCPGKYGVSDQVSFCSTPHGLYAYSTNLLAKADVKAGKWEIIAEGGPKHDEHGHLCHDTKRNQLVYLDRDKLAVWTFDFSQKKWEEKQVQGKSPVKLYGDSTYIPEMDAVLLVMSEGKDIPEKLFFYKLAENKWYSAPSEGDQFNYANTMGRDFSPFYDSQLKAIVRLKSVSRTEVAILRLDIATLAITPLE